MAGRSGKGGGERKSIDKEKMSIQITLQYSYIHGRLDSKVAHHEIEYHIHFIIRRSLSCNPEM